MLISDEEEDVAYFCSANRLAWRGKSALIEPRRGIWPRSAWPSSACGIGSWGHAFAEERDKMCYGDMYNVIMKIRLAKAHNLF